MSTSNKVYEGIQHAVNETPLFWAARTGDLEVLKELLNEENSLEKEDDTGSTILVKAAYHGQTEIVKYLIDQKAQINHRTKIDATALYWASQWGHTDCVKHLLKAKADPNIKKSDGDTALIAAAGYSEDIDIVKLLIKHGANIHETDNSKRGVLMAVAAKRKLPFLKYFLDLKTDPNIKDNSNLTPLMQAARWGYIEPVKLLIEYGAKIDFQDDQGKTALELAKQNNKPEMVLFLENFIQEETAIKLSNIFNPDKWIGKTSAMIKTWRDIPKGVKKDFNFSQCLTTARQKTFKKNRVPKRKNSLRRKNRNS